MFISCMGFYETDTAFMSKTINFDDIDLTKAKYVVKAHEKKIYCLSDNLILAKIHRDNQGDYPFSKIDFLSHKLQEIIFPSMVPKIHFAIFDNPDTPLFILDRVKLDKLHIAYNIKRQQAHKADGKSYYFDSEFLKLDENDDLEELATLHFEKVNVLQKDYAHFIDKYGIAFDYSHVNITWKDCTTPVSLEVHKCRRDYLFNLNKCRKYVNSMNALKSKQDALTILNRIEELL